LFFTNLAEGVEAARFLPTAIVLLPPICCSPQSLPCVGWGFLLVYFLLCTPGGRGGGFPLAFRFFRSLPFWSLFFKGGTINPLILIFSYDFFVTTPSLVSTPELDWAYY